MKAIKGYVSAIRNLGKESSCTDDDDCQVEKRFKRTGFVVKPEPQSLEALYLGICSLNHKPLLAFQFVVEIIEKRLVAISVCAFTLGDIGE